MKKFKINIEFKGYAKDKKEFYEKYVKEVNLGQIYDPDGGMIVASGKVGEIIEE